jgi:diguanylate cyclase
LLLGDVDYLRRVNKTYGHATGDTVLVGIARLIREGIGSTGFLGRFGGEEYVVLLPDASEIEAVQVAERVRCRVQDHPFSSTDGRAVRVTISIGVAIYPRDAEDLLSLYQLADRAAHQAKAMGRNRVCVHRVQA